VGPDIWEVASALRHTTGTPEERVAALAEQFDLHPRHIRTAIDFAATHRDVIEEQIAANDQAAEQARELAARRAISSPSDEIARCVSWSMRCSRRRRAHCLLIAAMTRCTCGIAVSMPGRTGKLPPSQPVSTAH
jgi:hypothetical protein